MKNGIHEKLKFFWTKMSFTGCSLSLGVLNLPSNRMVASFWFILCLSFSFIKIAEQLRVREKYDSDWKKNTWVLKKRTMEGNKKSSSLYMLHPRFISTKSRLGYIRLLFLGLCNWAESSFSLNYFALNRNCYSIIVSRHSQVHEYPG